MHTNVYDCGCSLSVYLRARLGDYQPRVRTVESHICNDEMTSQKLEAQSSVA